VKERERGDVEASKEWLRKAASADPDSAWICGNCGNVVADWEPVCGRCKQFDRLSWGTPPRVTQISAPDPVAAENPDAPDAMPEAEIIPPGAESCDPKS